MTLSSSKSGEDVWGEGNTLLSQGGTWKPPGHVGGAGAMPVPARPLTGKPRTPPSPARPGTTAARPGTAASRGTSLRPTSRAGRDEVRQLMT